MKNKTVKEIWGDIFIAREGVNPDKWKSGEVPGIDRGRDENTEVIEIELDGDIPPKFNGNQIVSYGEEDIGDEAGIYIVYSDGSERMIQSVTEARKFFVELYSGDA